MTLITALQKSSSSVYFKNKELWVPKKLKKQHDISMNNDSNRLHIEKL